MVVSVDVVVLNHGCIYAGECLRGVPEGKGTMKNLKGWILEGQFSDGVMTEGTIIYDISSGIRQRFNSHVSDGNDDNSVLGKRTLEERLNDEMEAAYARGEVIDLT